MGGVGHSEEPQTAAARFAVSSVSMILARALGRVGRAENPADHSHGVGAGFDD